jgi:transportin-1
VLAAYAHPQCCVQALAEIEESALELCTPHLAQILEVLVTAFSRYQAKNLLILFDAVSTLAEAVGKALAHPEIVAVLIPAVLAKWEKMRDDERALICCTECICALVGAMGDLMLPYVEVLYSRIMRLVQARTVALADPSVDPPEFEYPTVSLDLLSCIIETLGVQVAPLLESTGGVAIILAAATTDPHTEVRSWTAGVFHSHCHQHHLYAVGL